MTTESVLPLVQDHPEQQRPDLIIEARWVIPVQPHDTVYERHAVAIRDGRISSILPINAAIEHWPHCSRVRLDDHALLPGLVNTHTHMQR